MEHKSTLRPPWDASLLCFSFFFHDITALSFLIFYFYFLMAHKIFIHNILPLTEICHSHPSLFEVWQFMTNQLSSQNVWNIQHRAIPSNNKSCSHILFLSNVSFQQYAEIIIKCPHSMDVLILHQDNLHMHFTFFFPSSSATFI